MTRFFDNSDHADQTLTEESENGIPPTPEMPEVPATHGQLIDYANNNATAAREWLNRYNPASIHGLSDTDNVACVAILNESFALAILDHMTILDNLSPKALTKIAISQVSVLQQILDNEELGLDSDQLYSFALADRDFAMQVITHENILSSGQIEEIKEKHSIETPRP